MGRPVITVASGGRPVVDVTSTAPMMGLRVTESTNGFGMPVTKVAVGKFGMPVVYAAAIGSAPAVTYTTWNNADKTLVTLSNGNLTATGTGVNCGVRAVSGKSSGKYYWEVMLTIANPGAVGISTTSANLVSVSGTVTGTSVITANGNIYVNGTYSGTTLGGLSNAQIIGISVDFTAGLIWYRKAPAGNWNASGTADPATGVGGLSISAMTGPFYPSYSTSNNGNNVTANFGASAFSGAVPSGFTAGWPA